MWLVARCFRCTSVLNTAQSQAHQECSGGLRENTSPRRTGQAHEFSCLIQSIESSLSNHSSVIFLFILSFIFFFTFYEIHFPAQMIRCTKQIHICFRAVWSSSKVPLLTLCMRVGQRGKHLERRASTGRLRGQEELGVWPESQGMSAIEHNCMATYLS